MLVVGKNQAKLLIERVQKADDLKACIDEVRRMVQIKSTLLWRADAACSCVGNGPANMLFMELSLLESTLDALERGDVLKSLSFLREYLDLLPNEEAI